MRVARGHYMYTVQTLALALVLAPPCYAIMAAGVPEEEHQRLPTHIHPFLPHLIPFVLQEVARAAKAKLKKRGGAGARGETRGGCLGYSPICSSCSPAGSPCGLYSVAGGGSSSQGQGEEAGRSRSEGGFPRDVKEGGDGRSTMSGEVSGVVWKDCWGGVGVYLSSPPHASAFTHFSFVCTRSLPSTPATPLPPVFPLPLPPHFRTSEATRTSSRHDRSKKSAWSNALSSSASKKAQHGRPQLHERITETGGDTPLDLLGLAGTRRALSAPLLKPTHGTLSSGATGGGAGGGGLKRHRDGGGEGEGERKDAGFEYTEDGKMDVLNETEGGEGGTGGGSGRKGGAKKGVGAGEDDGEGNLDYGVMEDDDVAMGDASLASARAAELAFGRHVRGARGAKGGEGGEGRGGAGAGGGGGRKKARPIQVRPGHSFWASESESTAIRCSAMAPSLRAIRATFVCLSLNLTLCNVFTGRYYTASNLASPATRNPEAKSAEAAAGFVLPSSARSCDEDESINGAKGLLPSLEELTWNPSLCDWELHLLASVPAQQLTTNDRRRQRLNNHRCLLPFIKKGTKLFKLLPPPPPSSPPPPFCDLPSPVRGGKPLLGGADLCALMRLDGGGGEGRTAGGGTGGSLGEVGRARSGGAEEKLTVEKNRSGLEVAP
ncbi:unnamed protein product, partial [Closterium sp. NIES-53]